MEERAAGAFRRHYRQVYGYVRRRTASDADAEDVAADVFADAVAGLERLSPDGPPELAWLYTVAKRRLVDSVRREARTLRAVEAEPRPAYGNELARTLRRSIASLPEGQRQVVVMKLIEGMSFAEIAGRVGASEAACKMRCSRGLEALRELLEAEGVEP